MRPCLSLLGREGCHLCEDMAQALDAFKDSLGFDYRVIDVDAEPALQQAYGLLVPVLMLDGREICHYHLDRRALETALGTPWGARSE